MGRTLDTTDIKDLLYANADSPGGTTSPPGACPARNCTMVCPTCFCTTVEDVTDLTGDAPRRSTGVSGTPASTPTSPTSTAARVRESTKSRYRQWMTHKLGSWIDQFGTSGCVGCGRCVTWCPAAIDITDEVAALRGARATCRRPCTATTEESDMQTIAEYLPEHPFFAGLDELDRSAARRVRRQRALPARRVPLPRGRAGRPLLRRPTRAGGPRGARCPGAPRGGRHRRRRRRRRLVVAGAAVPVDLRRPRHRGRPARSPSTVPACAASARRTPPLGYALLQRVVTVMYHAAAVGAGPAARPLRGRP